MSDISGSVVSMKVPGRKRASKGRLLKRFKAGKYLFLLAVPMILYLLIFRYAPMYGLIISFFDYNSFKGLMGSEWVGLKYYSMFFQNPDAFRVIRNTLLLGLYRLLCEFPAPIIFALILNEVRNIYFKKTVQTISYLPHFISNVVVTGMVIEILSPRSGLVNNMLGLLNIEPIYFMGNPGYFRTIYVLTGIWQELGWSAILYLAALSGINPELYEAAIVDGANKFKQLIHITIPCLLPTIAVLFILNTGSIIEVGFEKAFLLQSPPTYETADVISTFVYRNGIVNGNFSFATAVGFFTSVISLIFVFASNYLSRKVNDTSVW